MENAALNTPLHTSAANTDYAGFWLRFVACIIDAILLGFIQFIVIVPIMGIFGYNASFPVENMNGEEAMANFGMMWSAVMAMNVVTTVIGWLYYALMESGTRQGTVGKMALGLKVTNMNGERISFLQATARYFGKIISTVLLMIGYLMAAFTEKKQALHDIIAGCLVLRGK